MYRLLLLFCSYIFLQASTLPEYMEERPVEDDTEIIQFNPKDIQLVAKKYTGRYYSTHEDFSRRKPSTTLKLKGGILGYTVLMMTLADEFEVSPYTDPETGENVNTRDLDLKGQWTGLNIGFDLGVEFMRFFRVLWGFKYASLDCNDDCYYMNLNKFDIDLSAILSLYTPMFNLSFGIKLAMLWGNFDGPNITNSSSGLGYGGVIGFERMVSQFQSTSLQIIYQAGSLNPKSAWKSKLDNVSYGKASVDFNSILIVVGVSGWDTY